jgi:DNA-binding GntR family transcriptional regulator
MSAKAASAGSRAYEQLRTEILEGVLAPGAALYEVEQSSRLGVSRTPVREAFGRLVADGLVEPSAGRGLVVTAVSDRDIDSLFELRASLEAQAAQLAASRGEPAEFEAFAEAFRAVQVPLLDPHASDAVVSGYYALIRRFDRAVNAASGNQYLVDAMENLRTHVARARRMASHSPERLSASAAEHALIAEAIARRDGALAVHATHVHLHHSLEHFRHTITRVSAG